MGLRFRKSISIIPGVKLNLGKTGMSVSTGVPGFRKTFHTSGKVTTSVGIPGTGLYYVDTESTRTRNERRSEQMPQTTQQDYPEPLSYPVVETAIEDYSQQMQTNYESNVRDEIIPIAQLDPTVIKSIHKMSDDSVDWTEVLVSPVAPDDSYNQEMWKYYHDIAPKVLSGAIDTYLQLIYEVNPLDDLLAYGSSFEFGTDDPRKIEVEFIINEDALRDFRDTFNNEKYHDLLQDYVCSTCIRIARDMFALLPVRNTFVHAVLKDETILSVNFDQANLAKVKFGYVDPSDTLSRFCHNMDFSLENGFSVIDRL